jgi:hypothetical protein
MTTELISQPVVDPNPEVKVASPAAFIIKHEVSANSSAEDGSGAVTVNEHENVTSDASAPTQPAKAPEPWKPMTADDLAQLTSCEKIICDGIDTFIEVGTNLAIVRDNGLYRGTYPSFEAYITGRWKFTKQRAYQLMAAAGYHNSLATRNPKALQIKSERATRELMKVPDDLVVNVLETVTADGNATAERIIEVRNLLAPKKESKPTKAKAKKKPKPKIEAAIKGIGVWAAYLGSCDVGSLDEAQRKQLTDLNKKAVEKFSKLKLAA